MKLKVKVGDRITSATTGIMYIVKNTDGLDYEVYNTEEKHRTWLYSWMVTDKNFYKN